MTTSTTKPSLETTTSTMPENATTEAPKIEPPVLPEAAKENTEEGAVAFTEYFVEVLNYSAESLNEETLNQITVDTCNFCTSMTEYILKTRSTNDRIANLTFRNLDRPKVTSTKEGVYALDIHLDQSAHLLISEGGSTEFDGTRLDGVAIVSYEPKGWLLHTLGTSDSR